MRRVKKKVIKCLGLRGLFVNGKIKICSLSLKPVDSRKHCLIRMTVLTDNLGFNINQKYLKKLVKFVKWFLVAECSPIAINKAGTSCCWSKSSLVMIIQSLE